jgi:hypothetical protein
MNRAARGDGVIINVPARFLNQDRINQLHFIGAGYPVLAYYLPLVGACYWLIFMRY